MDKFKEIRPIVLGIAKNNEKILVSKGHDKILYPKEILKYL